MPGNGAHMRGDSGQQISPGRGKSPLSSFVLESHPPGDDDFIPKQASPANGPPRVQNVSPDLGMADDDGSQPERTFNNVSNASSGEAPVRRPLPDSHPVYEDHAGDDEISRWAKTIWEDGTGPKNPPAGWMEKIDKANYAAIYQTYQLDERTSPGSLTVQATSCLYDLKVTIWTSSLPKRTVRTHQPRLVDRGTRIIGPLEFDATNAQYKESGQEVRFFKLVEQASVRGNPREESVLSLILRQCAVKRIPRDGLTVTGLDVQEAIYHYWLVAEPQQRKDLAKNLLSDPSSAKNTVSRSNLTSPLSKEENAQIQQLLQPENPADRNPANGTGKGLGRKRTQKAFKAFRRNVAKIESLQRTVKDLQRKLSAAQKELAAARRIQGFLEVVPAAKAVACLKESVTGEEKEESHPQS